MGVGSAKSLLLTLTLALALALALALTPAGEALPAGRAHGGRAAASWAKGAALAAAIGHKGQDASW